eukprot:COSAG03_NODE_13433_length_503_cov_1.148515_1_plen_50_part_10
MSVTGPIIMLYLLARPDQVDHRQDGYHLLRTTLQHTYKLCIQILHTYKLC